jgi:transposase InsO family protein
VVEIFFASLKAEEVDDCMYVTRYEARAAMFEFIEVFYNRVRRHSSFGFTSPALRNSGSRLDSDSPETRGKITFQRVLLIKTVQRLQGKE